MTGRHWEIVESVHAGLSLYHCQKIVGPEQVPAEKDTEVFDNKKDAVLRCRSLNAALVGGYMADGHPQNW